MAASRNGGRSRWALWGLAALALTTPILVLRARDGVTWRPGEALFLVLMLSGVAVAEAVAANVPKRRAYAAAIAIALAATLLQAWLNLAVGIVGNEDDPINLIYAGVLLIAAAGTALARLRPHAMARAMIATAIAQTIAFAIVLISGRGFTGPITLFFVALWLASAQLFHKAAPDRSADVR